MDTARATFAAGQSDPQQTVAALERLGFVFAARRPVRRSLLDTFDGRVEAAGLRLELRESRRTELIVSGSDTVPAAAEVPARPIFVGDLPAGPLRARLGAVIEVRALLPVISITATGTDGVWCDRAGKAVATVAMYEGSGVDGHDDADVVPWTIEVVELTGYSKRAGAARTALEELGLLRLGDDTLAVAARAAGIDLGGTTFSPTVPLDVGMPAVDGFRLVLANLADTITANWEGTVDDIDPEFLHDLRVAMRRTRSVLGQGKRVLPPTIVEWARERFGWLAGQTGPTRDLDVYLIEWDTYTRPLAANVVAALAPVRDVLERHRAAAAGDLSEALRSDEAAEVMSEWEAWLRHPIDGSGGDGDTGDHADRMLGEVVARRIVTVQDDLIGDGRAITPTTPAEQVHELRKDAKKLRYLLECFGSIMPSAPRKAFVQRLKAFQDNLGEHQDAEVHVAELRAIARQLHERSAPAETMTAIGQLTEQLDRRRIATRTEFAEQFDAYDSKSTRRTLASLIEGIEG